MVLLVQTEEVVLPGLTRVTAVLASKGIDDYWMYIYICIAFSRGLKQMEEVLLADSTKDCSEEYMSLCSHLRPSEWVGAHLGKALHGRVETQTSPGKETDISRLYHQTLEHTPLRISHKSE